MRLGWVVRLRAEKVEEYKRLHAAVWAAVLERIWQSNIRDYTIFLREPENLLFAVFDYVGEDFDADMAAMAGDPKVREWWMLTEPCQQPFENVPAGDVWARMEQVFHCD